MTKRTPAINFKEGSKNKKENLCSHRNGITKTLLEKYKPSKELIVLDCRKKEIESDLAA